MQREHDARGLWDFKGAYHDIAVLKRGADLDAAIDDAVCCGHPPRDRPRRC